MKRKSEVNSLLGSLQLFVAVKKQLRSKAPRRPRRFQVSPDFQKSFDGDSTVVSSVNDNSRVAKHSGDNQKAVEKKRNADHVEISETSCVDSYPAAVLVERESKLRKRGENQRKLSKFGVSKLVCEESEVYDKSETTVEFSGLFLKNGAEIQKGPQSDQTLVEVDSNDVVPVHSDLTQVQKSSEERSISRIDREERQSAVAETGDDVVPVEIDYTCSENFSNEDFSGECDYGYSSAFSALLTDSVPETSELDLSDFAESIWDNDSGSQFSEKSNESSSPTFQLFLQFSHELCRSNFHLKSNSSSFSLPEDHDFHVVTLHGLDDKDDIESYKMIKMRERRQVYLQDYITEYCSNTGSGELIIEQRIKMVHWIYEQFQNKDLQRQTMFLGVSLLDRFLSNGYFKTKRNLQIVGVACLTLARRIEENQPFNSVREKVFQLGSSTYSRSEVVAMEWLVQEVLKFKCYLPTIYDFIWFYLKATRASEKVSKMVNYMAVLALLGFEQLRFWPSTVAAGLVVLASTTYQNTSDSPVVETHALENDDDLPECIESLTWLLSYTD